MSTAPVPSTRVPFWPYLVGLLLFLFAGFVSIVLIDTLPLVPNWPYTRLVCFAVALVAGAAYMIILRCRQMSPQSPSWPPSPAASLRVFPFTLAMTLCFWSFAFLWEERHDSLEFDRGVVTEKFHSHNHNYPALRVRVEGRGVVDFENIPKVSWEMVSVGSVISKKCGSRDIAVMSSIAER